MTAKSKVPQIRFKGFIGEWENKKLEELANFSKGQGYSKSDLVDFGTSIILYGRLYTKYQTVISKVDTFVLKNDNPIFSKGNEVIVPSSGETAEDIARASAVTEKGTIFGGDLNIIYPNNKIDNIFLALNISNGRTQKELSKKAQGKSVVHLRNTDLKEINLYYPYKIEQTKIGSYFQNLDKLIEQKEKKQQKLKQFKKAMLDKMFPKNGANTPEIRFKGFGGEWEEKEFDDIFDRIPSKKYQINSNEYKDYGLFPVVDQGKKRIVAYSNNILKVLHNKQSLIIFGDHTRIIKYINFDFIIGADGIQLINAKVNFDNQYFFYTLQQHRIPNTGYNRHFKFLKEINFIVPKIQEQTKIGNYFQKLDNLIDLQHQELKKLKNIKKASLAKMFV